MPYSRLLVALLRLTGSVEILAFGAVVMPRALMVEYHAALGLGEFPPVGVTDFLIRQSSYVYGMHGVVLWLMSFDPGRYRPLLWLTSFSYTLAGPVFYWIDATSGLPAWWTIGDSTGCFLFGGALLALLSKSPSTTSSGPNHTSTAHSS